MPKSIEFEVSLEGDLCSGCGLCVEISPSMFTHVEGVSHVKQDGVVLESMQPARVPNNLLVQVIEAAEVCPGEIITLGQVKNNTYF